MEDYNSKYTGEQVEEMLDQIANGEIGGGGIETETDPIFSASPAASITDAKKAEWDNKVDKVDGKGLSTEDFTTVLKQKLEGLSNYDDAELSSAITTLRSDFDTLVSGDTTTAIKTFNEVIAFLEGLEDTEDLAGIIASIEQQLMWTKAEGEAGVRLKGTNGTATGNLAISAGDDKTASDGTQFTSVASGDHAVVFGYGNTCAGRTTLAQGLYNIVNGKDSVAFGQRNLVNGDQAFAAGQQNEVTTRLGVAIGYKNKATNTDSVAIGYQNTSSGSASVSMGDTCEANGTSSTAMGYKTKATGAYSSTFGENTQATNEGEVAMGLYNKSTTSTDTSEQTAFSFGIGTSDTNRVNAFEIKKNGDVYIGDKVLSDFATTTELNDKVDKISGKQLSTEDFTSALKTKLEGLSNYDDTEIENAINSLQTQFNTLVSGNASDAINSFNEIVAFLDGVQDTEDLSSIIASIEQQIASKQDKIDDLETIRSGAAKGATALQSYTEKYTGTITGITMNGASKGTSGVVNLGTVITEHQDISGKADKSSLATVATSGSYNDLSNKPTIPSAVTESTVSGWGFTKNTGTYSKPSGGIPKSDLASAVQTSLGKADTALQSIPSEYITESELNEKGYATTSELTSGLSEKASITQVESMITEAITNTLNTEV